MLDLPELIRYLREGSSGRHIHAVLPITRRTMFTKSKTRRFHTSGASGHVWDRGAAAGREFDPQPGAAQCQSLCTGHGTLIGQPRRTGA